MNIVQLKALDGTPIEFDRDAPAGSGAMKDVYFSPDKTYVVGFFRKSQDANSRERLNSIVTNYRKMLFENEGGKNIEPLFCWPSHIVEWNNGKMTKLGVVCPTYDKKFFFSSGKFKGKEQEGKWFASAKLRNKFLEPDVKGNWLNYLQVCIKIARAVKRLHAAGLAHSDLSYKNILINPLSGDACIIDIDGLVVPGKYPPDVAGTPDFIAPEVLETIKLDKEDPKKNLPQRSTDQYALAVLIYMYLLYRHPLRGGMVCDPNDSDLDERLVMGKNALFIEHPSNLANRPNIASLSKDELPQGDTNALPYTLTGPYLKDLFDRAFIKGLHDPKERPTADEWERALIKTVDLIQPCANKNCQEKYFVFDNTKHPKCPFCGTPYDKPLPILNFYYKPRKNGSFINENLRLMVFNKQSLYKWHIDRNISPNEKIKDSDRNPVGDFLYSKGKWWLINRSIEKLLDVSTDVRIEIPQNQKVELKEGLKLLFLNNNNLRMAVVQISNIKK